MQVDAAGRLEHPLHLQQADTHEAQECAEAKAVGVHGRLNDLYQRLVVVAYLVHPLVVDVVAPAPLVGILAALTFAVAARIEGGAVAIRPTVLEFMPRSASRLSMWKMVPGAKLS